MAQSLAKNYIHIVFSTKNRENIIKKEDLAEVFSYIAGVVKGCECNSICVGGTTNHIHLLPARVPHAPNAFSTVPVSLWHHVLRKSPACGNPPGGASASFYLQEYLGSKVFCLMEEAVCLPPRSSSVKFPSFGKRVQILGLEKEREGGEKNDKFQSF